MISSVLSNRLGSSPKHTVVIWTPSVTNVVMVIGFQLFVYHIKFEKKNIKLIGKGMEGGILRKNNILKGYLNYTDPVKST